MKPDLGLDEGQRQAVAALLNRLLADEVTLATKTRKAHWNVTGPHFNDLHLLFGKQYDEMDEIVDDVAERVRALGGPAAGTLQEYSVLARLKEEPGVNPTAHLLVATLLADHEAVIRQLREDLETCAGDHRDMGTSDFLTGLMEQHEKTAWMLRATLGE